MKAIYLFLAAGVLILTGCDDIDALVANDEKTRWEVLAEALGEDEIEKRGQGEEELVYALNTKTPYTGWIKAMWSDEELRMLARYKDGRKDGLYAEWHEDGYRMKQEGRYKDGKKHGLWLEWDNKDQESTANYVDGELANP